MTTEDEKLLEMSLETLDHLRKESLHKGDAGLLDNVNQQYGKYGKPRPFLRPLQCIQCGASCGPNGELPPCGHGD